MRPVQLELEGFASFRDRVEVNLEGAELFVLSGPTGAGKSSLIDAMVFALYGSVPRYDDRRLVAPVITQGHQQARVRFTFDLDGERYSATRVVRRTPSGGASTKEARLERAADQEVLAGNADELTTAVEQLIGLSFDHFTRTVVLPQGDFQEFLHARPRERQELLVQLLDLDVYGQVAQRANQRAKDAGATAEALRSRLESDLVGATPEALAEVEQRLDAVERLEGRCNELRPVLERAEESGRRARERQRAATDRLAVVRDVAIPDQVAPLAQELAAAARALDEAKRTCERITEEREAVEAAAAEHPPVEVLRAVLDEYQHQVELTGQLDAAREEAAAADTAVDAAAEALETAERVARETATTLRELEHRHLAHSLREGLETGSDCPVCERTIDEVPAGGPPADLARARTEEEASAAALEQARNAVDQAQRRATAASTTLTNKSTELEKVATKLSRARDELGLADDVAAIEQRAAAASDAAERVTKAKDAESRAKQRLREAERARAGLAERERAAWSQHDATRDRLAAALAPSTPPSADRDDLAGSWHALATWAAERRPEVEQEAQEAAEAITDAETTYRRAIDDLLQEVGELGVEVEGRDRHVIFRAVTSAHATAQAERERLAEKLDEVTKVREKLEEAERERDLASELGKLLDAKHFQQWLLNRALRYLVVGASEVLEELSSGAYALTVADDGSFGVIDHRNADEVRPARTLSGGETFLASLALALALSDHVAELAAKGSARLEALFLDEGFGTLDADTLDTVAAAIEELGARGRMVGLVTHVRELAERVPVRFEVRRSAATSTVERVER